MSTRITRLVLRTLAPQASRAATKAALAALALGIIVCGAARTALATPVTGWSASSANTTLIDANTNDPTATHVTTGGWGLIYADVASVTLTNTGDQLSLTGTMDITGGMTVNNGIIRFGLYDRNGHVGTDVNGWLGYLVLSANSPSNANSIFAKTGTNNDATSTTNAVALTSPASATGSVPQNGILDFSLLITKTDSGLDIATSLAEVGGGGYSFSASASHATPTTTLYNAVGIAAGSSGFIPDQVVFSNIDLTFTPIPEPATITIVLTGCAGLLYARWRRRRD